MMFNILLCLPEANFHIQSGKRTQLSVSYHHQYPSIITQYYFKAMPYPSFIMRRKSPINGKDVSSYFE